MNKVLGDDDDDKWVYREHTAAKHEVYQKYLTPWTYKLSSRNPKIRVVDCFAGRGFYVDSDGCDPVELECIETPVDYPGSPQIILDRLTKHSDKFDEAEAVFIEKNDSNFDDLTNTLENTTGIADNIHQATISGKFQEKVLSAVNATDGSDCPTLFLIDPFGFKALDYDVITKIGSTPQFELLITFMNRDINRFFDTETHEDAISNMFKDDSYKTEVDNYSAENWVPLVEYYTDQLEDEGPEYTFEYRITEPDTRQTVYYLVFGSNHPEGLKVMREVMKTCGTGSFGYAPKDPKHDRQQTGFGHFNNDTKQYLKNNFGEFRIEFNNLVQKCIEDRKYGDAGVSEYREAVKELEKLGELQVIRRKSKRSGVQKGDIIDFRDSPNLDVS
jgi:three-Cys-motif partner protein